MTTRIVPHVLATFVFACLLASVGCSGGNGARASDAGLDGGGRFSGAWTFSEMIVDPSNGIRCNDQGTWTLMQGGSVLTGQDDQTGTCTHTDGTSSDNADSEPIENGTVDGATITFTEEGAIPCVYTGTASGDPPAALAGTTACVGTFEGTSYDVTGSWQATKQ
jgi:hypothetical protein